MKPLRLVLTALLSLASTAQAQNVLLNPTATQTITQPSATTLDVNVLNNESVVGLGSFTSIGLAITAAGSNGSVLIPPSYTGTDFFSANSYGIHVDDQRPLSNVYAAIQVVNAAQYGAICNGSNNDTAAIQAALNAQYAFNLPLATQEVVDVVLPQGSCLISSTLNLGVHGSLTGQGDATYLVADYAGCTVSGPACSWGSSYTAIAISTSTSLPGGASDEIRRIGNMNIIGISDAGIPSATAISVINNGNTYSSTYAFPNMRFDHLQVSGFDTGFLLEDIKDSVIDDVNVNLVRVGLNFYGQVLNTFVSNSDIEVGSYNATSQRGVTTGILIQPNTKYSSGCASHAVYCAPQGIIVHDTSVVSFDDNINVQQCVECNFHHNNIDECGAGPVDSGGDCVLLGQFAIGGGLWISNNWLGLNNNNGYGVYSEANTTAPNAPGFWIENNYFYGYNTPSGSIGVALSGTSGGSLQFGHINGNVFYKLTDGIYLNQSLTDSVIRDNQGTSITTDLINLSGVASLAHTNTVIDSNTDSDSIPVLYEGTATGFRVEYNVSAFPQVTGTFVASGLGCTITAGAIGNSCTAATITLPVTFQDYNFVIPSCLVQSGNGHNTISSAGILTPSSIQVVETALSATATGGGTIFCTVVHQ